MMVMAWTLLIMILLMTAIETMQRNGDDDYWWKRCNGDDNWWRLVMTIGNCGKYAGWFPTLLSPPASCQLCKLYHHDLDWSIIQNKHYHSNKHCHHPSSITQEIVIFCKRVKSGGRVFIMKSWWKELRPKGSLYCAGPNIDHMWLGAPPQPPSTSFDQRQRLRSSLSDRQHPKHKELPKLGGNCCNRGVSRIMAAGRILEAWRNNLYWRATFA